MSSFTNSAEQNASKMQAIFNHMSGAGHEAEQNASKLQKVGKTSYVAKLKREVITARPTGACVPDEKVGKTSYVAKLKREVITARPTGACVPDEKEDSDKANDKASDKASDNASDDDSDTASDNDNADVRGEPPVISYVNDMIDKYNAAKKPAPPRGRSVLDVLFGAVRKENAKLQEHRKPEIGDRVRVANHGAGVIVLAEKKKGEPTGTYTVMFDNSTMENGVRPEAIQPDTEAPIAGKYGRVFDIIEKKWGPTKILDGTETHFGIGCLGCPQADIYVALQEGLVDPYRIVSDMMGYPTTVELYMDTYREAVKPDYCSSAFMMRHKITCAFAWWMPTKKTFDKLCKVLRNKGVLSLGCGMGIVETALKATIRADGGTAKWVLTDISPATPDVHEFNAVDAVHKFLGADVLFIAWPTYRDPWAYNALQAKIAIADKSGEEFLVVYVGEEKGGCTAEDLFFDLLNDKFKIKYEYLECKNWGGIHDGVSVYKYGGSDNESDSDSDSDSD